MKGIAQYIKEGINRDYTSYLRFTSVIDTVESVDELLDYMDSVRDSELFKKLTVAERVFVRNAFDSRYKYLKNIENE
jgi:hypothetical protein